MTLERVGLDVGGTRLKAGRISEGGEVCAERTVDVPDADSGGAALADLVVEVARDLGAEGAVGIGVPGLIDREAGLVTNSPNIPHLEGLPLRERLGEALGLDAVLLENDANVAALGEAWLGAARGEEDVLVVTLGTGVGGSLLLGGELYVGHGLAGEIGHVRIDKNGPVCGCGGRGCLETFASATAARRRALERGLPAEAPGDLELLSERAREPGSVEAELLFEIGHDLGIGLSSAVCLLDLRAFVIGGGFSAALHTLEPGIRAGIREGAYGPVRVTSPARCPRPTPSCASRTWRRPTRRGSSARVTERSRG
jgi:glucokinase